MLHLVPLAVVGIAVHHTPAQDFRQSTATAPVYLPSGQTDASILSVILASLREPSLLEAAKDATVHSFRVTFFSPVPEQKVAVRLIVNVDGSGQITSAVSSGTETGVRRTTNDVSKLEVDKLLELVDKAGFWAVQSTEPQPDENGHKYYVLDGAWWMLEGVQKGSFHYVFRRNPKPTPITEIGCYLAKNLVKSNGSVIPMPGCAPPGQVSINEITGKVSPSFRFAALTNNLGARAPARTSNNSRIAGTSLFFLRF
jgi:hypothetical protein